MRYDMSLTHVNFTQNTYFSAASSKLTKIQVVKKKNPDVIFIFVTFSKGT